MSDAEALARLIAGRVSLRQYGARWVGLCPFHAEKTPSLGVFTGRDGKGRFYCHGCGARGDMIDWLSKVEGMSTGKAMQHIGFQVLREPASVRRSRVQREILLRLYRDRNPACCLPDWAIDL